MPSSPRAAVFAEVAQLINVALPAPQVVFYGEHYAAFVRSGAGEDDWRYMDDASVRSAGSWEDVKGQCERGKLQASALFYEAC